MIRKMKRGKKGVSAVVATVLLVLVTFMAIGLIIGFIIPMVKESLGKGKSCFELRDYVTVVESEYTCYNSTHTKLMIERGMEDYEIKGFVVSILSGGESKRYDVEEGSVTGIKMLDGSEIIEIPEPGEARTYVFDTSAEEGVRISIMQKEGSVCQPVFYDVPACLV